MATKQLKTAEIVEPQTPDQTHAIKVSAVKVESAGQTYKHVTVNLPADFQLSWLGDYPAIWQLVQRDQTGKALCEYDKLELRHPEWTAWAVVNYASADRVYLYDVKRAQKPARDVEPFSDENYAVRFAEGGGYSYFRKSDNVRMSNASWPTPESAKAALMREQYAGRVA